MLVSMYAETASIGTQIKIYAFILRPRSSLINKERFIPDNPADEAIPAPSDIPIPRAIEKVRTSSIKTDVENNISLNVCQAPLIILTSYPSVVTCGGIKTVSPMFIPVKNAMI